MKHKGKACLDEKGVCPSCHRFGDPLIHLEYCSYFQLTIEQRHSNYMLAMRRLWKEFCAAILIVEAGRMVAYLQKQGFTIDHEKLKELAK